MAGEFTQETILNFLKERGGKVKNTELIEHFQLALLREPLRKAAVRRTFKSYVDNVAFVKTERGIKHVCLRRMFSGTANSASAESGPEPAFGRQVSGDDDAAAERPLPGAARAQVQQQTPPGSGCGSDKRTVPRFLTGESALPDKREESPAQRGFVCVVEDSSGEMGNRGSFTRQNKEQSRSLEIPEITVIGASPLPVEGAVFILPGPAQAGSIIQSLNAEQGPRGRHAEAGMPSPEGLKGAEHVGVSSGSHRFLSKHQESVDRDSELHLDAHSLSGGEENGTPKGSRKHFIKVMISSSPEVRRRMVLENSSDSISLSSANMEDERTSVTLDPAEHEWMMCASDAEWGSLSRLLAAEPSLVLKKDFVTGFTCLHWAAKHGKPELMALIVDFAKKHGVPISVDVRSNVGYTPLHVAAMHNHMEVVKLLVGAYNADVDVRDYSGRKACQYLTDSVSVDIRDIVGAYEHSETENADRRGRGHWRFSKALRSSLKPLSIDHDSLNGEGRPREPPVRRRSSLSGMKPKLQKLRLRTSQIVHSTSFRNKEELESPKRGSFKSRPKTHFFG